MRDPSPEELRAHLKSLPQELYDQVWRLTFTAEPGLRDMSNKFGRAIHRSHLRLLHIDSASRAQYAGSYYGEGAMIRHLSGDLGAWLHSLPQNHLALIGDIICIYTVNQSRPTIRRPYQHRYIRKIMGGFMGEERVEVMMNRLRIQGLMVRGAALQSPVQAHARWHDTLRSFVAGEIPESELVELSS